MQDYVAEEITMANVFDVADHILKKKGELTAMKLQKLVYYSQAWHSVWEEEVLFPERIEAWLNGPVCPVLYAEHRGKFKVDKETFKNKLEGNLTSSQLESIDSVINYYGDKTSQWLSDLTHQEQPWQQARKGLAQNERGTREITVTSMQEFYEGL